MAPLFGTFLGGVVLLQDQTFLLLLQNSLDDQSRSSTKHLIEIHSVTSDNRELYLYEILKKVLKVPDEKKVPDKKVSGNGDSSRKRKFFSGTP